MSDLGSIATLFKFLAVLGIFASIMFMIFSRVGGGATPPPADVSAPVVEMP